MPATCSWTPASGKNADLSLTSTIDALAPVGESADGSGAATATPTRRSVAVLWRSKKILVGLVIIGFFAVIAVIGPLIAPYDPSAIGPDVLQPPSAAHWLGTTQNGQDVLSQVLVGTRTTMVVGFLAAVAATLLSVVIGVTAGYLGGSSDDFLTALANIFLVVPALPLVIVLAGYLPNKGSVSVAIVIAITGWAWGARVLRAQTLSIRRRDFIEAARATGERTWRIIAVEVLPNDVAIIATGFLFTFIFAILTYASLAFLGLANVSVWSWGTILYWAQNFAALNLGAWWWFVPPGLCIALLGMGLALVNFGIDEFINPRLRTSTGRGRRASHGVAVVDRPAPPAAVRSALPGTTPSSATPALEVRGLSVVYGTGSGAVGAVTDVDLVLHRGELLGLAGESGSGKSTLAYALTRLLRPPGRITSGQVIFHREKGQPVDVLSLGDQELRALRWHEISMVFQSAMNALNPVMDVATQLTDVLGAHRPNLSKEARLERAADMLQTVGISGDRLHSYPHQLSGGMRQRVMIAMALLLEPEIIVMDEPTTALDVVMQRSILEEIDRLRATLGFSVIFITHDLSLLTEIADRIAIMYASRMVETGPARDLYTHPLHPYSQGLRQSFPPLHGERRTLAGIPGSPPDMRAVPSGCAFHPRCQYAMPICSERRPDLLPYGDDGASDRKAACWLCDKEVSTTGTMPLLSSLPGASAQREVGQ
jgi:peptide/nickel transport system permease protein